MDRPPKPVSNKRVIGRIDKVDLPEFQLEGVACKVDTGAATSAIHCNHVHVMEQDGERLLYFSLLDPEHTAYNNKTFFTKHFQERVVKSSSGQAEQRFVIETPVVLFGETFYTQFTLADRENMRFPILLGRRLLRKNFIVDVSRTNLSAKKK
jgi:hypothetical protein